MFLGTLLSWGIAGIRRVLWTGFTHHRAGWWALSSRFSWFSHYLRVCFQLLSPPVFARRYYPCCFSAVLLDTEQNILLLRCLCRGVLWWLWLIVPKITGADLFNVRLVSSTTQNIKQCFLLPKKLDTVHRCGTVGGFALQFLSVGCWVFEKV